MWFFKRKVGIPATAVIHDNCYQKLPAPIKKRFSPAAHDAEVTHTVTSDGDGSDMEEFMLAGAVEGALDLMLGSKEFPTENYSVEETAPMETDDNQQDSGDEGKPDKGEFGGGTSDGGGAGDSY